MATINTALLHTLLVSFESNALPLLALFATFPILIESDNVRGRDCQTGCGDDQVCCLTCSNDYLTWSSIENLTESFSCSVNCVNDTSCLGYHCRSHLDCGSSEHCCNWTCHREDNCSNFRLYGDWKACGCQKCCYGMCGWSDALCSFLTTLAVFGIMLFAFIFYGCVQTLLCHVCNCKSDSSQPEGSRANLPGDIEIIDLERETDTHDIDIVEQQVEQTTQGHSNYLGRPQLSRSDEQGYCNQQIFGYSPPHVPTPTSSNEVEEGSRLRCSGRYLNHDALLEEDLSFASICMQLIAASNEPPSPPPYREVVEESSTTGCSGSYLNHDALLEEDLAREISQLTPTYMHRLAAEANELPPPPPYNEVVEEGSRTGFSGSYLNHVAVLEEDLPLERSQLSPTHMHHLVTELNELPSPPPYSEVGEERFRGEGPERD